MNYDIWNTLHDGSIESIRGTILVDVHVRVGIEYLCKKLPTTASHVIVHLRECRQFEYRPFEGAAVTDLASIASADAEVLSAKSAGESIDVICVGGLLRLVYNLADITLAEGQAISEAELESAADRYWTEWEENARRGRG